MNQTIVIRHRKENLKKCTMQPLVKRDDFRFYRFPGSLEGVTTGIVLAIDAPQLSIKDADKPLIVIDATWRYAEKMLKSVEAIPSLEYRSLPKDFKTAYPRKQDDCNEPSRGLASIEALYIAYKLLNRDTGSLLDHYYWKESFLEINKDAFSKIK